MKNLKTVAIVSLGGFIVFTLGKVTLTAAVLGYIFNILNNWLDVPLFNSLYYLFLGTGIFTCIGLFLTLYFIFKYFRS